MKRRMCRNFDLGRTGHPCTTVIGVKTTQETVFANDIPVARKGDPARPHKIRRTVCSNHNAQVNRASRTVFAEGIGVARTGDSFDRGKMIKGSNNVFAGG